MLREAGRHLQRQAVASADTRRIDLQYVAALQRMLQRRLAEALVDGAQQERPPSEPPIVAAGQGALDLIAARKP